MDKLLAWYTIGDVDLRLDHVSAVGGIRPGEEGRGFSFGVHLVGGQNFYLNFEDRPATEEARDALMYELTDFSAESGKVVASS